MFQFGFANMFPERPRPFNVTYTCYSVAMLPGNERQDVEKGGKIIMPPSALEQLTRLNIIYPMLFKLTNKKTSRVTHSGVLEFVADEGKVYLPLWMMHNLALGEGDNIQVESVYLPVGNFAKFQPLSPDFLDITNPKAVLENCLRTFACLTTGDIIVVKYNQKAYELCVLETKPGNAISIIECDMNVEFAAPVGYKEPTQDKKRTSDDDPTASDFDSEEFYASAEPSGFVAFSGAGTRLDGKTASRRKDSVGGSGVTSTVPTATSSTAATEQGGNGNSLQPRPLSAKNYARGIPDYEYKPGYLRFIRKMPAPVEKAGNVSSGGKENDEDDAFRPFSGKGFSLKRT